jgi:hypothetical protein
VADGSKDLGTPVPFSVNFVAVGLYALREHRGFFSYIDFCLVLGGSARTGAIRLTCPNFHLLPPSARSARARVFGKTVYSRVDRRRVRTRCARIGPGFGRVPRSFEEVRHSGDKLIQCKRLRERAVCAELACQV